MLSQVVILILLILLNAYFAATEIAFISLNDTKVEKQAKKGNKKAKQIVKMLKDPSKFLATIQIGITFAGFLSSAFASNAFADKLAPILYNMMPIISLANWQLISIIVITIILSFFTLVLGELVPKRLAMKYYEKISFFSIGIISVISIITLPFVKFLTFCTNLVSKMFGVTEADEEIVTEEEIKLMVDEGQEKGTIEESEKEMINNIFELNDTTAAEVMIHRKDIFAININDDIYDVLDKLDEYKYSRVPVFEKNIDNIKGILFIKDILKILSNGKHISIKEIMREADYVSKSKPINKIFKDLQKNKKQMAIVVDEFGGTAGLITMEDILEEIVGNIFDEYDDVEQEFEKIDDSTFMISGSVNIYDLKKILKVDIPEGEYDTLSGYLIEKLGHVPKDEEKPIIETKEATYKIEEYSNKRILWVKACKNNNIVE